jgi:hypothetical protein
VSRSLRLHIIFIGEGRRKDFAQKPMSGRNTKCFSALAYYFKIS